MEVRGRGRCMMEGTKRARQHQPIFFRAMAHRRNRRRTGMIVRAFMEVFPNAITVRAGHF